MTEENNVIVAHEILHTFGATDKYDPATTQPRYPDGYAEPGRASRMMAIECLMKTPVGAAQQVNLS